MLLIRARVKNSRQLWVSEDVARFSESIRLARDIEDNPFGEPESTFTNFQNGNGIFSVRNSIEGKKLLE